jgi:DNA-binding Xre family transcriptional regulator
MLSIDLTHIFKARGIDRPYTFLVKAGFTSHTAHSLLNSSTRAFKLDHIELLCKVLICEPNDLLVFALDKDQVFSADHPLLKLKQVDTSQNWTQTLATMPYKKLKEIAKQINLTNQSEE